MSAKRDDKYLVEVQRIRSKNLLCVFAADGRLLLQEETNVAFSATFGPDGGDVAQCSERATQIVDSFKQ